MTSSPSSVPTATVIGALLGGASLGAAAVFVTRGRSTPATERAMRQAVAEVQNLRREVQHSVSNAESRLGARLQNQERVIGNHMSSHYQDLNKRLDTVSAARTELSHVARKVEDLQGIFLNPRTRGTFGELQLEALVQDVMHPGSYDFQYTLSNGKRPDCLLRLPQPIGNLAIDSKFPFQTFLETTQAATSPNANGKVEWSRRGDADILAARQTLAQNLRKHIREIADKYIIPGETAECAMLFLPSEAIFAEVVEHHSDILSESHHLKVWIACPTTLMAILTTVRGMSRNLAVSEQAETLVAQVDKLLQDVERLVARTEKVEKSIDSAKENFRHMRKSVEKIRKRKIELDVWNDKEQAPADDERIIEEQVYQNGVTIAAEVEPMGDRRSAAVRTAHLARRG